MYGEKKLISPYDKQRRTAAALARFQTFSAFLFISQRCMLCPYVSRDVAALVRPSKLSRKIKPAKINKTQTTRANLFLF